MNMVDMEKLASWPLDKLTTARGYICENCQSREAISCVTTSLQVALDRLLRLGPTHRSFRHYFGKALRRAEEINRRNNGTRGHTHLAAPG